MSDNVIQFERREPDPSHDRVVWRCNCGCLTFFIRADAEVECAQCGVISEDCGSWRARSPDEHEGEVPGVEPNDVTVTDLNSPELAIRRVVRKIEHANLAALVVINSDGSLSAWGDAEGAAQSDWLMSRLLAAHNLLSRE